MKSGSGIGAFVAFGLGCGLCAALAGGASADPARTQWTAFMRLGPGEQFAVIDEIELDSAVDVRSCAHSWCLVISDRAQGYMPADVLRRSALTPPAPQSGEQPVPCFRENLEGFRGSEAWRICGH